MHFHWCKTDWGGGLCEFDRFGGQECGGGGGWVQGGTGKGVFSVV